MHLETERGVQQYALPGGLSPSNEERVLYRGQHALDESQQSMRITLMYLQGVPPVKLRHDNEVRGSKDAREVDAHARDVPSSVNGVGDGCYAILCPVLCRLACVCHTQSERENHKQSAYSVSKSMQALINESMPEEQATAVAAALSPRTMFSHQALVGRLVCRFSLSSLRSPQASPGQLSSGRSVHRSMSAQQWITRQPFISGSTSFYRTNLQNLLEPCIMHQTSVNSRMTGAVSCSALPV